MSISIIQKRGSEQSSTSDQSSQSNIPTRPKLTIDSNLPQMSDQQARSNPKLLSNKLTGSNSSKVSTMSSRCKQPSNSTFYTVQNKSSNAKVSSRSNPPEVSNPSPSSNSSSRSNQKSKFSNFNNHSLTVGQKELTKTEDKYSEAKSSADQEKASSKDTDSSAKRTRMCYLVQKAFNEENAPIASGESVAWLKNAIETSRLRHGQIRFTARRKSLVASLPSERCPRISKCSPIFDRRRTAISRDLYDFESKLFQETMKEMGRLKPVNRTVPPKDRGPYHCPPDIDIMRSETFLKPIPSVPKQEDKKELFREAVNRCNAIDRENVPNFVLDQIKEKSFFDLTLQTRQHPGRQVFFPKSTVRVRYPGGQSTGGQWEAHSHGAICKLMTSFGTVLYMVPEGNNSVLVIFELMKSAYKARVNLDYPTGVTVEWLDCRFTNFGQVNEHMEYAVSKDKVWKKCIEEKVKIEKPNIKITRFSTDDRGTN